MQLGKRIYVYRKLHNYTLHRLTGDKISTAHLSKIENNYRIPGRHILKSLSEKLELPESFLQDSSVKDAEVHSILSQIHLFIIQDMEKADPLIHMIDLHYYEYLACIEQEVYFLLLKAAYYYKNDQNDQALHLYEHYLVHYLADADYSAWPLFLKGAYYYFFGIHYYQLGDYDQSFHSYKSYLEVTDSLPVKAALTYNLGFLSRIKGENDTALNYCKQALSYYDILKLPKDQSMTYNLVGVIHWSQENYAEAMNYLEKAETLSLQTEDKNLLAQIYHNKAIILRKQQLEEQAIPYLEKTLQLKKSQNKNPMITYHTLCRNYLALGKLEKAKETFKEAEDYIRNDMDYYKLLDSFLDYYKYTNEQALYEKGLMDCIDFFKEKTNNDLLKSQYKKLGYYYYENNKYKRASECFLSLLELNESN
ncbi:helix-turn-helix transcriptional regulator [Halobacillus salinarum]|uniref:Helix-turn-helix transcriptional regulator n=1 Tax=Halobacillus salinarum TaxID=2932257 RepID=A0ABY4EIY9_9BACI|nr:helix-turn-helix transcriptional regulator [Halobacillus salinarum]UOQ44451.1 helix-turn-helix transcriptional regulator [Halobacillus salinarum]